jgi:hypothetical protein
MRNLPASKNRTIKKWLILNFCTTPIRFEPQNTHCNPALKKGPNYPFRPTFRNPKNTVKLLKTTVHHEILTVRSIAKIISFFYFSCVIGYFSE